MTTSSEVAPPDPTAGELYGLQWTTVASPAWQRATSVWDFISNYGDSGGMVFSSWCFCSTRVGGAVWWPTGVRCSELSFGFVLLVSMSQYNRPKLYFFLKFEFDVCWYSNPTSKVVLVVSLLFIVLPNLNLMFFLIILICSKNIYLNSYLPWPWWYCCPLC